MPYIKVYADNEFLLSCSLMSIIKIHLIVLQINLCNWMHQSSSPLSVQKVTHQRYQSYFLNFMASLLMFKLVGRFRRAYTMWLKINFDTFWKSYCSQVGQYNEFVEKIFTKSDTFGGCGESGNKTDVEIMKCESFSSI